MSGIYIPPTPALIGAVPTSREVIAGSNVTIDGGASADLSADIIIAATGGGGGGGALELIERRVLVSPSASELFNSLGAYEDLIIQVIGRSDQSSIQEVLCHFNGDSVDTNYFYQRVGGASTTASAGTNGAGGSDGAYLARLSSTGANANTPGCATIIIPGYNRTVF